MHPGPEIAQRTGLSPGSVRVNLHRGMALLRVPLAVGAGGRDWTSGDTVALPVTVTRHADNGLVTGTSLDDVTDSVGQAASLPGLFWSGLRAGLLTFGGAYTVIPFIQQDAVLIEFLLHLRKIEIGERHCQSQFAHHRHQRFDDARASERPRRNAN